MTSTSLLARVQAAEPQAWQRFVDLYGPVVYQWARQCQLSPEDSADIVQEVFVTTSRHIARFERRAADGSFRGWLWTITRNKIRDHCRRQPSAAKAIGGSQAQQQLAQMPDLPLATEAESDAPATGSDLYHRALEYVRASVEDHTWTAFWQVVVDDRAAADVAEELGMSVRAVYEAKYRVRRRIQKELSDVLD